MIKKFAGGGTSVFTTYKPFVDPTELLISAAASGLEGSGTSKGSGSSESKLSDKDLMNMIKEIDGLPSDMDVVLKRVLNLLNRLNTFGVSGINSNSLSSIYLQALGEVKKASWNKEQYDNAYKVVEKNGGLSQPAISSSGAVYVLDKEGNLKTVSVKEYMTGKYTPVTNSNLLWIRAHDPNHAYQNDLFSTVENGIGMEKVTDLIKQATEKLGSSELERQGYQSKQAQEGLKLLQEVKQSRNIDTDDLMSVDGLYKSKLINKNQKAQAELAIDYVWRSLPNSARALLCINSGLKDNPDAGGKALMSSIIIAGTSDQYSFTSELQPDLNADGSKKSGSGSKSDEDGLNMTQRWQIGLGDKENFTIQNGTYNGFVVNANRMRIETGINSSLAAISKTSLGGALDFNNISAGGVMLSAGATNQILSSDGKIYKAELPYVQDQQGNIKPDFDLLQKLDEADQIIKEKKITDPDQINAIYQEHQLPVKYDSEGNLNAANYTTFAMMNANILSSAFEEEPAFNLTPIKNESEINALLPSFQSASGEKKIKFDKPGLWDNFWGNPQNIFSTNDWIYQATVYMPMSTNIFSAMTGDIKPSTANAYEAAQQQHDNINSYNAPTELLSY